MTTTQIILYIVGTLLMAFILFWLYNRNKIAKLSSQIPTDVLETFNEAERRYKESGGQTNPNKILWDIGRERAGGAATAQTVSGNIQRNDLSGNIAENLVRDEQQHSGTEKDNSSSIGSAKRRRIFGRH